AGPLAKQDAVAGSHVQGHDLPLLIAGAGPHRGDLTLHRLLLSCVRNDNAACGLLFSDQPANDDAVAQGTEIHEITPDYDKDRPTRRASPSGDGERSGTQAR